MSDGALLVVENLSVTYGSVAHGATAVVETVSLELERGRCLGVIGESGAGKTQAFLAMMGLLPAQARVAGRARLEGVDLLGPAASALRGQRVAMIFQDPMTSLTPHLRIGDQIAEPLVTHRGMSWKDARARAAMLFEQVQMNDVPSRLRQFPHELSGGMRQRAMIAMALACDPKLLIADEPTTALDVTIQAQILKLITDLQKRTGAAVILITHDLGVVAETCERVVVAYAGRKVEEAAVADLFARPLHPYTQGLMASLPRMRKTGRRGRLAEIPGVVPSLRDPLAGCAFAARCALATDRCRAEFPALRDFGGGHVVACHEAGRAG